MESPEIEKFRQFAQKKVGKKIKKVHTFDSRVFKTPRKKFEKLKGHKLKKAHRHGKYLALETDNGLWVILHFGMTGKLRSINIEKIPKHTTLLLIFDDEDSLAYISTRQLGFLALATDFKKYLEDKKVGKDSQQISEKQFLELFAKKRGILKNALNNQSVIAGIGNIYADEILYHAQLHPQRKINSLTQKELKTLYRSIQDVLEIAIKARTSFSRLPTTFIIKNRYRRGSCYRCKSKIKKIYVSSRPTYFCPQCQKKVI